MSHDFCAHHQSMLDLVTSEFKGYVWSPSTLKILLLDHEQGNLPFTKFRVQTTCVQITIALLHRATCRKNKKKHAKFAVAYVRCMNVTTLTFGEEDVLCVIVMSRVFFLCHPIPCKNNNNNNDIVCWIS